jgi:Tol biopolymer transport system component
MTRPARAGRPLAVTTIVTLVTACGTTDPGPSGSRIAFRAFEPAGVNLFSMSADGTDIRRLTSDSMVEGHATWSPDGSRIVFEAAPPSGSNTGLYVMSADGSGKAVLRSSEADNREPEWSPDGTRIAFTSFRVDAQGAVVESQRVWVMSADGSGGTPLAPGTAPGWSPDSRQLVFVGDLQGPGGVETGLFVMGSDGSGIVQLTDPRPAAEEDLSPEWSPDGAYIAFTRVALSSTPQATLFVVRPDGSGLRQLTGPTVQGYEPSWSPDGTELVFADGADGQIKIVGLDDPAIRVFPTLPASVNASPDWGPER